MQKIGGAIERIDDPDEVTLRIATRRARAFLGDDAVIGIGTEERIYNRGFGIAINLCHKVAGAFAVDGQAVKIARPELNDFGGFASGFNRRGQHRMHGRLLNFEKERESERY